MKRLILHNLWTRQSPRMAGAKLTIPSPGSGTCHQKGGSRAWQRPRSLSNIKCFPGQTSHQAARSNRQTPLVMKCFSATQVMLVAFQFSPLKLDGKRTFFHLNRSITAIITLLCYYFGNVNMLLYTDKIYRKYMFNLPNVYFSHSTFGNPR